jgi:hypothetical protein
MHEFDPTEKLIRTWAQATLRDVSTNLHLALDTGCAQTVIRRNALAGLKL